MTLEDAVRRSIREGVAEDKILAKYGTARKFIDVLLSGEKSRLGTSAGSIQHMFTTLPLDVKLRLSTLIVGASLSSTSGRCIIHFSGGLDSLALLAVVNEALDRYCIDRSRILVLHIDTGLHPPGTSSYVKNVVESLDLDLKIFRPVVSPWWIFRKFGFPGKDRSGRTFPFTCCLLLKKLPTWITARCVKASIDFLGWVYREAYRRYMTVVRRGIVHRVNFPNMYSIVRILPIYIMTKRDIYRIVEMYRLERHWIYNICDRHACMACTADMSSMYKCLRNVNPRLYNFIIEKIREWGFENRNTAKTVKKKIEKIVREEDYGEDIEQIRKRIRRRIIEEFEEKRERKN